MGLSNTCSKQYTANNNKLECNTQRLRITDFNVQFTVNVNYKVKSQGTHGKCGGMCVYVYIPYYVKNDVLHKTKVHEVLHCHQLDHSQKSDI